VRSAGLGAQVANRKTLFPTLPTVERDLMAGLCVGVSLIAYG
jgi:hypothetical protein